MIYYENTMPKKITLIQKITKEKYVFYKSTTTYLAYDDAKYDAYIENPPKQESNQQKFQMSVLL